MALGKINDGQPAAWLRPVEVAHEGVPQRIGRHRSWPARRSGEGRQAVDAAAAAARRPRATSAWRWCAGQAATPDHRPHPTAAPTAATPHPTAPPPFLRRLEVLDARRQLPALRRPRQRRRHHLPGAASSRPPLPSSASRATLAAVIAISFAGIHTTPKLRADRDGSPPLPPNVAHPLHRGARGVDNADPWAVVSPLIRFFGTSLSNRPNIVPLSSDLAPSPPSPTVVLDEAACHLDRLRVCTACTT